MQTIDPRDSAQQIALLLQQKYAALAILDRANETLDDKASKVLQAGSLIVALTALLGSPFVGARIADLPLPPVLAVILAFMAMVGLSIASVSPKWQYVPGTQDWAKAFRGYVFVPEDAANAQILSDLFESIDLQSRTNARKASLVRIAAILLLIQIAGILWLLIVNLTRQG